MNNFFVFFILVFSQLVMGFISKEILATDELFITSLSDQLTVEQINKIVDFQDKWQWLGYILLPLLLLVKIALVAGSCYRVCTTYRFWFRTSTDVQGC